MRVVLFTGKGGVGKTTIAAATAARAATEGHKTLVISTDPAHSLGDALGRHLHGTSDASSGKKGAGSHRGDPPRAVEVGPSLFVLQVDTQRSFEQAWQEIQRYLIGLLDTGGIGPVEAEEITVLPGAEEVLALLAVRDAVRSGSYDVICVDCAPTAETLRLLRLPEALAWWYNRLSAPERMVARSVRPLLGRSAGFPVPSDGVFEAVKRLQSELADVRALLADRAVTSVRLVLTPEQVVVAEARRMLTALTLHGYRVDGVVANRVFPDGGGAWQSEWAAAQRAQLVAIGADFAGLPLWQVPYAAREPVGVPQLVELARRTYGDDDPVAFAGGDAPLSVVPTTDGFALHLALPLASRDELGLARRGDELVISVGPHRRVLVLPSVLRRCTVVGARLVEGELVVRFEPDPAVWTRS